MGNSSSGSVGLNYAIGDDLKCGDHWTISSGSKKETVVAANNILDGISDSVKEGVIIFKFIKTPSAPGISKLPCAQRNWQKLRTLKHPYILAFLDGADIENEALILVTEECLPLDAWLNKVAASGNNISNDAATIQELLWGFKCILNALTFIHDTCTLSHSYLGLHAIYVTKNGDWKLGSLDLTGNISNYDDYMHLKTNSSLLQRPYQCPERQNLGTSVSGDATEAVVKSAPWSADIYSLAQCINKSFDVLKLDMPNELSKYTQKMLSMEPKRRPTATQLNRSSLFNSEHLNLLTSLSELSIKQPAESINILSKITGKVAEIPVSICNHKILPSLGKSLQMSCNDFNNRDARESCRQAISLTLSLLSLLGNQNKIDTVNLTLQCGVVLTQLWTMSDRTVRGALLTSLKDISAYIHENLVNKYIFDQLLAGFADSNAKMREESLKSLVHVVDKLDEKNLQDKLVRCITNLQNDQEASIRTNATIFIGRITPKLKDNVRGKVLCNSYVKAMRDPFVHCRIAGLKAAIASVQYMDLASIATKLMPQVCSLLMDRSTDVRELSLSLLDKCTSVMKEQHQKLIELSVIEKEKHKNEPVSPTRDPSANSGSSKITSMLGLTGSNTSSDWTSWAVEGISKTIEKSLLDEKSSTSFVGNKAINSNNNISQNSLQSISTKGSMSSNESFSKANNWGDDDWGDDLDGEINSDNTNKLQYSNDANPVSAWDDDLDLDDSDTSSSKNSEPKKLIMPGTKVASSAPSNLSYKKSVPNSMLSEDDIIEKALAEDSSSVKPTTRPTASFNSSTSTGIKGLASKKKEPLSVKKLAITENDKDWEDF